jgi:hypothetical protein
MRLFGRYFDKHLGLARILSQNGGCYEKKRGKAEIEKRRVRVWYDD